MKGPPPLWVRSVRLSGSRTGTVRHISAFSRLKIAVFAPIPSASDNVTAAVKPGLFERMRPAYRISLIRLTLFRCGVAQRLEENLNCGGDGVNRQVFGVAMHRHHRVGGHDDRRESVALHAKGPESIGIGPIRNHHWRHDGVWMAPLHR